jgi:hypothetical protein
MPAASAGVAGVSPGPAAGPCLLLVSRRISVVHALGGRKAREIGAIPLEKLTYMTYPAESIMTRFALADVSAEYEAAMQSFPVR